MFVSFFEFLSLELFFVFFSFCFEVVLVCFFGFFEFLFVIVKVKEFVVDIFCWVKEVKGGVFEEVWFVLCLGFFGSCCCVYFEFLVLCGEVVFWDSFFVLEVFVFEFGYINYIKLYYVLEFGEGMELEDEFEDDKIFLFFVVIDFCGCNLWFMWEWIVV